MKQLTFNFLRRQLFLIMAVIGFSTSMLANTTDVTYTAPTYTCDDGKDFEKLTLRYATEMTLTCGENSDRWTHSGIREFYNVLSDFTIDAKAGETVTANFKANNPAYESKNSEDLRWTIATLHIDWNRDGNFESSEIIAGKTGTQIGSDNDYQRYYGNREYIFDITKDIVIPEGTTPGKVRVRLNYTNAWIAPDPVSAFATKSKEGIVYDFDINIVEPIESGLEVTWEQPENGTITVKNGTEVLESPATVEPGTKLTIVPAPASGRYELEALTANDTPITPNKGKYEVTINENTNIAATFSIAKYEINWTEPTNGTIKVVYADNETQEITKGSEVELDTKLKVIAEPSSPDYVLTRVYYVYGYGDKYDITKEGDSYVFTVQETNNGVKTIYIYAEFEKVVKYRITWAGEETMQGNSLKVVYADTDEEVLNSETLVTEGAVLKIIPTAVAGYHLSALSYTISGLQNVPFTIGNEPYTFTVEGGTEDPKMGYFVIISAEFTPDTYTLSTSVNPAEGGSVNVTTLDGTTIENNVTHGQTIVITASENDGYTLQSLDVTGATKVADQENQYTVEGDVTVTATFVEDAPVETWSEVTFDSMSGLSAEVDLSKYTYTGSWTKEAYGASEAVQMEDNSKKYGPFISKPVSGNYFATQYTVEKKATYRFSFLHKRADSKGAPASAMLYYATDLAAMTESSETIEVPAKAGNDSGDLFQSQSITLEPGDYYFIYYISSASMSGNNGAKIRIADFKLEMLDGSAVEPTPECTVTLNKPENGNLSVTYNNGSEDVTVSTDTETQTFNVAENTKLTVTVTPAEGYQLATLSPEMTKVADSETVYEYTVTEAVTIEATFTLIPDTDPIIGVGTENATAPVVSTADTPKWFVMKSSHLTVTDRQNRFMYWNEENSRLECTQHNDGIKLSEISDVYRWRFEDAGDGNVYIINKATGKALSVPADASSETGNEKVNTPLTLEETGSKWSFGLSSTVNQTEALPNQYFFDFVDYAEADRPAYLNAMDGQAAIPYGITVYEMGVQNASGWFIYEAPAEEKPKNNVKVETADTETGTVSIEGNNETSVSVEVGSVLTLKATPKAGYMFDKWTKKGTEEVVSYRHTFDLTVTEDTELVANFVEEGYPLMTRYFITNLSQQNRYFGEVGYSVGEGEIKQLFKCETEKELPFTAYPELHKQQREGAVIDKTENKIEFVEGTTEFNMLFKQYANNITYNNIVCEPEIEWTQQAIYIDWNNDKKFEGTEIYDRVSGSQLADANGMTRKVEVPAETKPGTYRMRVVQMQFDDNNNISHTNLFTENFGEIRLGMAYDFEIVVTPAPNKYPVTVATGITGGKITLKVDGEELTGEVEEGKTVTVEVTPDKYYELATLTYKVGEDGEEQDIKDTKSFNVTGETVVNATFNKLSYTVTFQQPQNGTIKVMNDKTEIQSGDKIEGGTKLTIVDTPENNYVLSELMAGETDILKDKSFIVENDTEIKAVFALPEYTFTYTLNGGSWVADITIKDGEGNVINNGDKVKFGTKYTIRAEKKNENNAVNFKVNGEQVIADVNGLVYTYTGTVNGDTNVTIDLYSDIESLDAEKVYYDANAHVLYTGGAKVVKVYDLNGRLVLNAENQDTISLNELADGIYTAVVDNIVLKLMK